MDIYIFKARGFDKKGHVGADYRKANIRGLPSTTNATGEVNVSEVNVWKRQNYKWTKINCNASWNRDTGRGSVGLVGRDHQGEFQGAKFRVVGSASSTLVVEAIAVREGMLFAMANNWNSVEVESDS
ncbi:hypothetical protein LIER_42914 [Lithospermum erythrorhizon]|uniref:RNase H type-1 domain-containing protein n=1 Tax=Lithospermum erythrorhizon TaxID=34254 RepID=A0AAV3P8K7_LITER